MIPFVIRAQQSHSALLKNSASVLNEIQTAFLSWTPDNDLTRKLKEAGKFLEIQLLDHLIVTTEDIFPLLMRD